MCDASISQSRRWLAGLGAATVCQLCDAGLVTIHEGGPTVPITQFTSSLTMKAGPTQVTVPAVASTATLPASFPVSSVSMHPGRLMQPVQLRTLGSLASPMFLIGDDAMSRHWLAIHREQLKRAGSAGMVVNVASLEAFRSLRALAPEIPMAFGSMDVLARYNGLTTYPLFISTDGRASQELPQ